jgi:hypothetical protein
MKLTAWIAERTQLTTVTSLLSVTQPLSINGNFSGSTILAFSSFVTICKQILMLHIMKMEFRKISEEKIDHV